MAAILKVRTSFTVPAGNGSYAPERITIPNAFNAALSETTCLLGVTALVEASGASGAIVELWLPKVGNGVTTGIDADYTYSGNFLTSGSLTWPLASYPGAQIRVKSVGSAGTTVVNATAD